MQDLMEQKRIDGKGCYAVVEPTGFTLFYGPRQSLIFRVLSFLGYKPPYTALFEYQPDGRNPESFNPGKLTRLAEMTGIKKDNFLQLLSLVLVQARVRYDTNVLGIY